VKMERATMDYAWSA